MIPCMDLATYQVMADALTPYVGDLVLVHRRVDEQDSKNMKVEGMISSTTD